MAGNGADSRQQFGASVFGTLSSRRRFWRKLAVGCGAGAALLAPQVASASALCSGYFICDDTYVCPSWFDCTGTFEYCDPPYRP